jgi:hypothetical protein
MNERFVHRLEDAPLDLGSVQRDDAANTAHLAKCSSHLAGDHGRNRQRLTLRTSRAHCA